MTVPEQLLIWNSMTIYAHAFDFNNRCVIEDFNSVFVDSIAWEEWEAKHRPPRRRNRRPRDRRRACREGHHIKIEREMDRFGICDNRWILARNGQWTIRPNQRYVPEAPNDLKQAHYEAVMEEYGWPIEDDDSHPEAADYRKRKEQQAELDALYYDDYMESFGYVPGEEHNYEETIDEAYVDPHDDDEESGWNDYDYDYYDYDY